MLTRGTCVRDREVQQVKVADTPDPKGMVRGTETSGLYVGTLFQWHPVYSRQLRGSRYVVRPWNLGSPTPPCLARGRENASVWEGWRRQRSSLMPGCNVLDMVKDCQEREKGRQDWSLQPQGALDEGFALDATVVP